MIGHIFEMCLERNGNGYEITSQNYFAALNHHLGKCLEGVARSSLSAARAKLSSEAFEYLLDQANVEPRNLRRHKWKGHVTRIVDGVDPSLPASIAILESFPRRNLKCAGHYPQAKVLTAINLMTGQPVRASLGNYHFNERDQLLLMIKGFKAGDLSLFDQGMSGKRVWSGFEMERQRYLCRVNVSGSCVLKEIREFIESERCSRTVSLEYDGNRFRVRLVRLKELDRNGSPIILATNLLNQRRYTDKELIRLYKRRWETETLYYRMKELLKLESFHARSVNGIRQEIWATLLLLSLTAIVVEEAEFKLGLDRNQTHLNFKNAIEALRKNLSLIVLKSKLSTARSKLDLLISQISRLRCRKQIGRHNPRISKQPGNGWNMQRPLARNRPKNKYQRSRTMQNIRT